MTNTGCCIHDANAGYSPHGTTIAFTTDRSFVSRGIREDEIWEMTAGGGSPPPLTSSVTPGGCPEEPSLPGRTVVTCVGPLDWSSR